METLSPEQIEELRTGRVQRERKLAVCAGSLHLEPADRAEILVVLSRDADTMVAERAQEALLSVPLEFFVAGVKRENTLPALFHYCARNLPDKPGISDALIHNKACPPEDLVFVVRYLSGLGVQALMEELDRVSASPALAAALEQSSSITLDHKKQLEELRSSMVDETVLRDAVAAAEPDPVKRETLLQRLSKMNVAQRVQLAIKGGSEERRTLIRDSSKVVQRAVLQSPRLTEREVESFAAMSNLTDDILRLIATNRHFRKNYAITRNLMNNPKTPLDVSLHMLPLLNAQDLKLLTVNKNIPETLRTTAVKLQRQRREKRQGG